VGATVSHTASPAQKADVRLDGDTVFEIGSITSKVFTALLLAIW
jgi:CubicO group peptidase (beta-lactamase class C family)